MQDDKIFVGKSVKPEYLDLRLANRHGLITGFNHTRVAIAALTLGTAAGAFDLAVGRAVKRTAFGGRIADHQAKSFEIAERHAEIEAARLALWKACWKMDRAGGFREEASIAKYLAV